MSGGLEQLGQINSQMATQRRQSLWDTAEDWMRQGFVSYQDVAAVLPERRKGSVRIAQ